MSANSSALMNDEIKKIPMDEQGGTDTNQALDAHTSNGDIDDIASEVASGDTIEKPKTAGDSIEPKKAVLSAYRYLEEVTPASEKIDDVRIEEVTPIESGAFWNVILSYDAIGDFRFDKQRKYKQFKIDSKTGKVISMKIHQI